MTTTIFGYGSLMEIQSALRTMPDATNFRPGELMGYCRLYNLVSISGIKSGMADMESKEMAALSVRRKTGSSVKGILFDIPKDQLAPYMEREHRYRHIQASVQEYGTRPSPAHDYAGTGAGLEGMQQKQLNIQKQQKGKGEWDLAVPACLTTAWTVVEQTDAEYLASLAGGEDEWQERVGQFYSVQQQGPLWGRPDVLPLRSYMISALAAAVSLGGKDWLDSSLDDTFLADGTTSLRDYIIRKLKLNSVEDAKSVSLESGQIAGIDHKNIFDSRLQTVCVDREGGEESKCSLLEYILGGQVD